MVCLQLALTQTDGPCDRKFPSLINLAFKMSLSSGGKWVLVRLDSTDH